MNEVSDLLDEAKALARRYRELTGRTLGITGEVAEFVAAKELGLQLANAYQAGYDAVRHEDGKEVKVQIKGRVIAADEKRSKRLGRLRLDKEWDTVLLVILDEDLEPQTMYEAERSVVEDALSKPGSKARNERQRLSVSGFKKIAKVVWNRDSWA